MTLESWNIILSAAILVLMSGGGVWLKYVVDQQMKSKDTAIQALEGVVKLKDAHISTLQGDTAPTIAKAYADMRGHADLMTQESLRLSEQLADLTKKRQTEEAMFRPKIILSTVTGMQFATRALNDTVWKLVVPDGEHVDPRFKTDEFEALLDQVFAATQRINQEINDRLQEGSDLLNKSMA